MRKQAKASKVVIAGMVLDMFTITDPETVAAIEERYFSDDADDHEDENDRARSAIWLN